LAEKLLILSACAGFICVSLWSSTLRSSRRYRVLDDVQRAEREAADRRQRWERDEYKSHRRNTALATAFGIATVLGLVLTILYSDGGVPGSQESVGATEDEEEFGGVADSPNVEETEAGLSSGVVVSVVQLALAICDEGPQLSGHNGTMIDHRAANPSLWSALDDVLPNADPASENCPASVSPTYARLESLVSADRGTSRSGPAWPSLEAALTSLRSATSDDAYRIARHFTYQATVGLVRLTVAICDSGQQLAEHRRIMDDHRLTYPLLWSTIAAVLPQGDSASAHCADGLSVTNEGLKRIRASTPPLPTTPSWPSLDAALAVLIEPG
jgi:hypothetical protein